MSDSLNLKNLTPQILSVLQQLRFAVTSEITYNTIMSVLSASAAEKLMIPYFEEIINQFRMYLGAVGDAGEEMFKLQIQTIGR